MTSIIIIYFLPPIFEKYKLVLIENGTVEPTLDARVYYADIDKDGNSEQLCSFTTESGFHAIQIFTSDGGTIDQWNFDGKINVGKGTRLVTGDYDKDNSLEVYVFYQIDDTVFMDCFEPLDLKDPFKLKRIKMFELDHEIALSDCIINEAFFYDLNGDSNEEIIISVSAGRARFPRGIIVYDIHRKLRYRSPKFGVDIMNLQIVDLDGDGKSEIFGGTSAGGNVHDSLGVPYSDYSAWIIVFDHELKLKFDPIEYPGFRSGVRLFPVKDSLIVAYYFHAGPNRNSPEFLLLNVKGEIIKRKQFTSSQKSEQGLIVNIINNKLSYILTKRNSSKLELYDENFKLSKIIDFKIPLSYHFKADLDGDLETELIFVSADGELIIIDNEFKILTRSNLSMHLKKPEISIIKLLDQNDLLYIQDRDQFFKLQLGRNPLASFKYLIFLGIFLVLWLFILLIQKLQLIQLKKKERIRSELTNLQLKSIKNQMDPHFTFNVFNTMALKIKSDSPETYKAFMQFTNLIRRNLESSEHITRTIEDEFSYLRSYLELEKLRFPDKLNFEISIDPLVNLEKRIPKMILQTYVENAIKHGIRHKDGPGLIKIILTINKSFLIFEISDDGVGREKAKELSTDSTGFGLKIMDNYFKLFNEYNPAKIKYEIIDLYNESSEALGTKILIRIPLKFNYKLKAND